MTTSSRPALRTKGTRPETRPRRGDPSETRRRLVAAAAVAFDRDGFAGTDSNRIAREAGYSPGTFYKHFADKHAAFVAVYEEWVRAEWEAIDRLWLEKRGPQLAASLTATVVDLHKRWRGLRRNLRALVAEDAGVRKAYLASRARQLEALAALGAGSTSRAEDAAFLYTVERIADAIADAEPRALGFEEVELTAVLGEVIAARVRRAGRDGRSDG